MLVDKANGKELEPWFFSPEEKAAFDKADRNECESVCNKVTRRLTAERGGQKSATLFNIQRHLFLSQKFRILLPP